MVAIQSVTKKYGNSAKAAVENLSLALVPGEIFGFLGPNGAGKSTTIKMIVGLLSQDTGTITVDGLDTLKEPVLVKQRIGYVPDEPLFYEKMTANEYLQFICEIYRVPNEARQERIVRWAKRFSLHGVLDDQISSFSRGMKQKLGIVTALVHEPRLLILDEPMVGLDPKSAFILKEVMHEFCEGGRSVFFSTHVMEVAERLCTRVGIIKNGSLIACDTFHALQGRAGSSDLSLEQLFLEMTDETE